MYSAPFPCNGEEAEFPPLLLPRSTAGEGAEFPPLLLRGRVREGCHPQGGLTSDAPQGLASGLLMVTGRHHMLVHTNTQVSNAIGGDLVSRQVLHRYAAAVLDQPVRMGRIKP